MSQNQENYQDRHMRLGSSEFMMMNNPVKRFVQRRIEFRYFRNMLKSQNINLNNKTIIDAGCGSGYSSQLIQKSFTPKRLIAFDYMLEQIELAKKRNHKEKLEINFFQGDIRNIQESSNTIDGVFVFGVIHHIPDWENALKEIARVLKLNGVLLLEEPRYRFTFKELENEMINQGLRILEKKKFILGYFRSYLAIKER